MQKVEVESIGEEGLLLKFASSSSSQQCTKDTYFKFEIAGFSVSFVQLRLSSILELDPTCDNFVKVIHGEIALGNTTSSSNERRRPFLRKQKSLLVSESCIVATADSTLVCVMAKTRNALEFIDDMKQATIHHIDNSSNTMQWTNVSKYNWGPQFDNLEFYNLKGIYFTFFLS